VGLDVHKAIVDNISANTKDAAHATFRLPSYVQKLIDQGALGDKAAKGLYMRQTKADGSREKLVYDIAKGDYAPLGTIDLPFKQPMLEAVQGSRYRDLGELLKSAGGVEADILRQMIARYVAYAFSLIPEVTDQAGIDGAMGFGFNWVPPSGWVEILGGVRATVAFVEKAGLPVPTYLAQVPPSSNGFYPLRGRLDYRQLFRAG